MASLEWTPPEIEILRLPLPYKELQPLLPGRSLTAIRARRHRLRYGRVRTKREPGDPYAILTKMEQRQRGVNYKADRFDSEIVDTLNGLLITIRAGGVRLSDIDPVLDAVLLKIRTRRDIQRRLRLRRNQKTGRSHRSQSGIAVSGLSVMTGDKADK